MTLPLGNQAYFVADEDAFSAPRVEMKAVGDLNGDGLLDIVTQQVGTDMLDATPLAFALGRAGGGFATDASLVAGFVPHFMDARVMIGDYTGDGITDFAVYDAGYYDWSVRTTIGGEPLLFVGNAQGTFTVSDALKVAALPFVRTGSTAFAMQVDLTMGVKDVISADIDSDGDLDFWVESTGSRNMTSHFLVNRGGTFAIDINNRVAEDTLFGPGPADYWRYGHAEFLDVNQDGAPDLVLGQIRDDNATHLTQSSFVLLNDGNGYFPQSGAIRLPLPDFYRGYTSAEAMASWDINRDGRMDLVVVHTRNDDVTGPAVEPAWTGTYVQILIQHPDGQFADETAQRIGSQETWSSAALSPNGTAHSIQARDVNGDGITDFVLGYMSERPSDSKPVLFVGRGDGSFGVGNRDWITGGDPYFGEGLLAVDLDGNAWTDFIHLDSRPGANGTYDGPAGDDYMSVVSQLGTGPLGGGGVPASLQLAGTWGADALLGGAAGDVLAGLAGNDRLHGLAGNDTLDGGQGIDTAVFSGALAAHAVSVRATGITMTDTVGSGGTDTMASVERAQFFDGKLAFDLDGNAGIVAKVIGAVFGAAAVQVRHYVGVGLSLTDGGMGIEALVDVALQYQLGASATDAEVVRMLYTNVAGMVPEAATIEGFTSLIDNGTFTRTGLGVYAAQFELNLANIGLVGLTASGLPYV